MSYATTILGDSPVSYWQLNETSGTTATDSSDSNNGTYTGGFTLNQSTTYTLTPAVLFNGTSGYVSVPDATNLHLTDVTMEAWIKTSSTSTEMIISKYASSSPFHGWAIGANVITVGKLSITFGAGTWTTGSITINDGIWHYIVGTISSGGVVKSYVDSILDINTTISQSLSNTANLQIGRDTASANFFNGSIMNGAVYNTSLTQTQVNAHYAAAGGTPAGRISQEGMLFIEQGTPAVRISQMGLLVIVPNVTVTKHNFLGSSGGMEVRQMDGGFFN